mmetsp:Transcript_56123/g.122739  ORF Transcript_56123/g.122739 Transcript_56123/m.122739 type:complete len:222 (-) Transcript_56123:197-862(-)
MPNGVTIIQRGSETRLLFINGHDVGLVLHRFVQHLLQKMVVQRHNGLGIGCHCLKELGIADHSHFDGFSQSFHHLSSAQSAEYRGVSENNLGLVESADEVLPRWHVQGSLATNTAVDHGHGGRGHLHHWDAPHVGGCSEAGQIAHHTTTQSQDGGIASALVGQHIVLNACLGLPIFGGLSGSKGVTKHLTGPCILLEGLHQAVAVVTVHRFIAHDHEGCRL